MSTSTTVLTFAALLIGIFVILSLNYNHNHYHDNRDGTPKCISKYMKFLSRTQNEVKIDRVPVDPYTVHTY